MAIQLSTTLRSAMIDAYETTGGTLPRLYIFLGSLPANCAAADANANPLAILTLPSDWISTSSSGTVTITGGPWTGTGASAGTATHYRLKKSDQSTVFEQGTVGTGSEDLVLDNAVIAAGQAISITTWTRIQGGA
jgi:hypothetical protein